MKLSLAAASLSLLIAALPAALVAQEVRKAEAPKAQPGKPTAEEIVQMVHLSRALKNHHLNGTLTKGDRTIPFTIRMSETLMRFMFTENNQNHIVNLDLTSKGTKLTEVKPGSNAVVPFARYGEGVKGTDLSYDDISFRYLYWAKKTLRGEESIKTRDCWVVDLTNPGNAANSGSYGTVRIWVDQESGGLMKMYGYDWQGKRIKECAVKSGMKVDGATVLREMAVYSFAPGSNKVVGETVFELQKP